MSDKLKTKFQNKCVGLTDDHRDYIYGTDWKGYAKALKKQVEELKDGKTNFIKELANRWVKVKALEKQIKELGEKDKGLQVQMRSQIEAINELQDINHGLEKQIKEAKTIRKGR